MGHKIQWDTHLFRLLYSSTQNSNYWLIFTSFSSQLACAFIPLLTKPSENRTFSVLHTLSTIAVKIVLAHHQSLENNYWWFLSDTYHFVLLNTNGIYFQHSTRCLGILQLLIKSLSSNPFRIPSFMCNGRTVYTCNILIQSLSWPCEEHIVLPDSELRHL